MNRLKLNRWIIALITLAMLALVFMPEEKAILIAVDSDHPEADYTMENVTIIQYASSGKLNHKLNAEKMIHYNESNPNLSTETSNKSQLKKTNLTTELSILEKPNIYYKTQHGEWKLSAKLGRMTNQQSLLFLEDSVQLTENVAGSLESTQVTTKDLEIDLTTKIAQTGKDVVLISENLTAKSSGMKIDIQNSKLHLTSNVHSQLTKITN